MPNPEFNFYKPENYQDGKRVTIEGSTEQDEVFEAPAVEAEDKATLPASEQPRPTEAQRHRAMFEEATRRFGDNSTVGNASTTISSFIEVGEYELAIEVYRFAIGKVVKLINSAIDDIPRLKSELAHAIHFHGSALDLEEHFSDPNLIAVHKSIGKLIATIYQSNGGYMRASYNYGLAGMPDMQHQMEEEHRASGSSGYKAERTPEQVTRDEGAFNDALQEFLNLTQDYSDISVDAIVQKAREKLAAL